VAYDTPVNREFLNDLGVYAPVGDVYALAEAIAALARRPAQRSQLGEALRRRAETSFSWPAAALCIEALYWHLTTRR